jgi:hypothetical protein
VSDLAEGSAALQKLLATGSEAAEGEIARDTGNMRDDHLRQQVRHRPFVVCKGARRRE